jgi:hypothetical protein
VNAVSWAVTDEEFKRRVAEYNREGHTSKPSAKSNLPANWEAMSLDALWNTLNDPERFKKQNSNQKNAPPQGRGERNIDARDQYQVRVRK